MFNHDGLNVCELYFCKERHLIVFTFYIHPNIKKKQGKQHLNNSFFTSFDSHLFIISSFSPLNFISALYFLISNSFFSFVRTEPAKSCFDYLYFTFKTSKLDTSHDRLLNMNITGSINTSDILK